MDSSDSDSSVSGSVSVSGSSSDDDIKPPALPSMMAMPIPVKNDEDDEDEDAKPAAAEAAAGSEFQISNIRRRNSNNALICMAVGCEKNAQSKTQINNVGGFCRVHFNSWLISTGQLEYWDCLCGNKVSLDSERCGSCHRWKDKKLASARMAASSFPAAASASGATKMTVDSSRSNGGLSNLEPTIQWPLDSGLQISPVRETNENGRSVCKVIGCHKLDQSQNDGFCRTHFNMLAAPGAGDVTDVDNSWTCVCGQLIAGNKKRCGKCNKWRGGKRDPYPASTAPRVKKPRLSNDNNKIAARLLITSSSKNEIVGSNNETVGGHWTCNCGVKVPSTKSRCGSCHHWRGGKRKGGWKIKANHNAADDSGIDWTQDWSCCGEIILATKKRCGSCHGWRGGRRVASSKKKKAASSSSPGPSQADNRPMWECPSCLVMNPAAKRKCGGCLVWKNGPNANATSNETSAAELAAAVADGGNDINYTVTEYI